MLPVNTNFSRILPICDLSLSLPFLSPSRSITHIKFFLSRIDGNSTLSICIVRCLYIYLSISLIRGNFPQNAITLYSAQSFAFFSFIQFNFIVHFHFLSLHMPSKTKHFSQYFQTHTDTDKCAVPLALDKLHRGQYKWNEQSGKKNVCTHIQSNISSFGIVFLNSTKYNKLLRINH